MSFGVHLFLLLIAAFIGVSQVMDNQVDVYKRQVWGWGWFVGEGNPEA